MLRGVFIGAGLLALAILVLRCDRLPLAALVAPTAAYATELHPGLGASAKALERAAVSASEPGSPDEDDTAATRLASYGVPSAPGGESEIPGEESRELDGLPSDDPYVQSLDGEGSRRPDSRDPEATSDDGATRPAPDAQPELEPGEAAAGGQGKEADDAKEASGGRGSADAAAGADAVLASIARETWVLSEPSWRARKLGYLRAGAVVHRGPKPVGDRGCSKGWYSVAPRGYVCVGGAATTDEAHPIVELSRRRPDLFGMPYDYVISRFPPPPLYVRLPTEAEQKSIEPELDYYKRKHARLATQKEFVPLPEPEPTTALMAEGMVLPALGGAPRGAERTTAGVARVRSGFALLGVYERDARAFGLTTELTFIPLDRTRVIRPSSFRGVRLSEEFSLPAVFVTSKRAKRYSALGDGGPLRATGAMTWREAAALTGESRVSRGALYYEMADGGWVRADEVVRLDPPKRMPRWARNGRRWVDVSILKQALVAYEGTTPVYATLVSTGADGIGDPETTHSTIQGTFLVHTKHVSVTMDGDEPGDQFEFNDVPFVQYFTEGYALHGTYWHDDFGTPRSHGCVNLAPIDAAWLFRWTTPEVPEGWHAALSAKRGTVVHVHP